MTPRKRSIYRAAIRVLRHWRKPARAFLILWLSVASTFGNCTVLAYDRPTFLGVPYGPSCEARCGVCPGEVAARCVPIHIAPDANVQLVADPTSAERWTLTIHDAVQIALANSEAIRNLGLQQAQSSDIDKIRAVITRYDPLAAAAAADAEWGIFDPVLTTSMQWYKQDIPPGTSFAGIGARPPRLDTAEFDASISQLLPSGGQFRADYVTDYLLNPDHPVNLNPNPQYFTYSQFGFSQPLMQGQGPDVTMAAIRIAAAKAEQTDWRFKQEVLALVRSVQTSYWSLYAQQQNLKVIDEVLPMFHEIVRIREQQSQASAGTEAEVAQARSDMLLYEQRRLETLSLIAEQQLVLRNLMGLSLNDSRYMVLVAAPAKTPPLETLGEAVDVAINRRPDILRQRLAVYVAQQSTVVAGDKMRPRLDFGAFWRINGLGQDLGSSIEQMDDNRYNDWQMGFAFQMPLGRRQARGELRAAQLTVQKERALLDQAAHQTSYEVADAYRRAIWLSQQQQVADARVVALRQWRVGAKAQFENPPPGMTTTNALQLYLQNLREMMDASAQSNSILSDFNSALSRLEEVKGTLLEREMVEVDGDGTNQLPPGLPVPSLPTPDSMLPEPKQGAKPQQAAPVQPQTAPATAPNSQSSDSTQNHAYQSLPTAETDPAVTSAEPQPQAANQPAVDAPQPETLNSPAIVPTPNTSHPPETPLGQPNDITQNHAIPPVSKLSAARQFANKAWQGMRFGRRSLKQETAPSIQLPASVQIAPGEIVGAPNAAPNSTITNESTRVSPSDEIVQLPAGQQPVQHSVATKLLDQPESLQASNLPMKQEQAQANQPSDSIQTIPVEIVAVPSNAVREQDANVLPRDEVVQLPEGQPKQRPAVARPLDQPESLQASDLPTSEAIVAIPPQKYVATPSPVEPARDRAANNLRSNRQPLAQPSGVLVPASEPSRLEAMSPPVYGVSDAGNPMCMPEFVSSMPPAVSAPSRELRQPTIQDVSPNYVTTPAPPARIQVPPSVFPLQPNNQGSVAIEQPESVQSQQNAAQPIDRIHQGLQMPSSMLPSRQLEATRTSWDATFLR